MVGPYFKAIGYTKYYLLGRTISICDTSWKEVLQEGRDHKGLRPLVSATAAHVGCYQSDLSFLLNLT